MTIHPCHYTSFNAFVKAACAEATRGLPAVTSYDGYDEASAKRAAIYAAAVTAEADARDRWDAHIEHMEELYERGVGPAWEGMC